VTRRLLRLEIPVFPERMMFRVHDPGVDPDAPGSPVLSAGSLISASREQLIVACAQEHIGVQLTNEDEAKCVLYLRGKLSVDMGSAGRAVESIKLSGGVGDYGARVYTRNRAASVQRYEELFQLHADPLGDEFQQARRRLEGLEQYLLQIWRES
jgi:hypothetical protein